MLVRAAVNASRVMLVITPIPMQKVASYVIPANTPRAPVVRRAPSAPTVTPRHPTAPLPARTSSFTEAQPASFVHREG